MNYVRCAFFSLPISSIFSLHTAHCCICVPIVCGWSSDVQCFKPEVEEWSADWVGYKHCADHDCVAGGLCKTLLQWSHLTEQRRRLQLGRGFISHWIISQQTSINTKRTCLAPILVCKIKMDQKWLLILVIVVSCQSKLNLIIKYYLICFFFVYCVLFPDTECFFFFSHFIKSFRIHFRDFQRPKSKGRG